MQMHGIDGLCPPSALLFLLEGRIFGELGVACAAAPLSFLAPHGDGHPVLVLPGLAANDMSTEPLRAFLRDRGYAAEGWGLGSNIGGKSFLPSISRRITAMRRQHGRKVSLIGWSLGGVFAREAAKRAPDDVRFVITLGSPIGGHPRSTNAWRLYERLSGESTGDPDMHRPFLAPPPVPTTSIYSRTDGIVPWRASVQPRSKLTENIEVEASHLGLGCNPAALYAIADRLAQPETAWRPFRTDGLRALFYSPCSWFMRPPRSRSH